MSTNSEIEFLLIKTKMYRIHLYFLIGFLFTLNGEKCDKYEEKVQVCKNRNEVDQTENIEKVSDLNNQGKIAGINRILKIKLFFK